MRSALRTLALGAVLSAPALAVDNISNGPVFDGISYVLNISSVDQIAQVQYSLRNDAGADTDVRLQITRGTLFAVESRTRFGTALGLPGEIVRDATPAVGLWTYRSNANLVQSMSYKKINASSPTGWSWQGTGTETAAGIADKLRPLIRSISHDTNGDMLVQLAYEFRNSNLPYALIDLHNDFSVSQGLVIDGSIPSDFRKGGINNVAVVRLKKPLYEGLPAGSLTWNLGGIVVEQAYEAPPAPVETL
jgi:hypothetical protein